MPSTALTPTPVPKTYAELRAAVLAVVVKGRRAIDRAWLETYHETGRLIHEHLLLKQERAAYGASVFARLAADTGISSRTLHECVQFYRAFPIVRVLAQLTWNHYRLLSQVADPARRKALLAETVQQGWSSTQLEPQVRALALLRPDAADAAKNVTPGALLTPKRGTPGVSRVATVDGALVVDLGFACYLDLTEEQAGSVKEGDLVRLDGNGRLTPADDATKADLFNYRVELSRVVDGDTLWVKIYLRPRQWVKQKLRLRGLDCPELSTPEGKAAKRFVDALVAKTTAVVINTTKPDKYDRYLADVFLTVAGGEEVFLNNTLLKNGQAVRKDAWQFGDWEPELIR